MYKCNDPTDAKVYYVLRMLGFSKREIREILETFNKLDQKLKCSKQD